jgi:hypothetical protein
MTEASAKAPWHLWLVGAIALLFNAMGAFDYLMWMIEGPPYLAQGGMTPAQIALYQNMPFWAVAVWAVGVFAAVIAALLLLLRRRLAAPLFALSFVAFLLYALYIYGIAHGGAAMGRGMEIMSAVIAALLLFFTWYARTMAERGVLR